MLTANRGLTTGAIIVALVLLLGSAALAMIDARANPAYTDASKSSSAIAGFRPAPLPPQAAAAASGSATGDSIASSYLAPSGGVFQPGFPPFGQGGSGNGIGAWGVAYKEVQSDSAQPDAALIKSAYQDAQKHAQDLASAAGVKLGNLLALDHWGANQPWYGECKVGPASGKPVPATGNGSTGSEGAPERVAPAPPIAQPVPAPQCQEKHYVVVWVMARYAIA